jgi:hypothetical protein
MKSPVIRLKTKERKKEEQINQVLTPALTPNPKQINQVLTHTFTPWQDEFYEEILKPKSASSILQALSCRFCRLQLSTPSKLVISKKNGNQGSLYLYIPLGCFFRWVVSVKILTKILTKCGRMSDNATVSDTCICGCCLWLEEMRTCWVWSFAERRRHEGGGW